MRSEKSRGAERYTVSRVFTPLGRWALTLGTISDFSRGAMPSNMTVKDDLEVVRVRRQKQRDKVGGYYNN